MKLYSFFSPSVVAAVLFLLNLYPLVCPFGQLWVWLAFVLAWLAVKKMYSRSKQYDILLNARKVQSQTIALLAWPRGMASLDFGPWLTGVLDSAGIDGEVFGGYISGTLDTLEGATFSEVEESLLETLQGCLVSLLIYTSIKSP